MPEPVLELSILICTIPGREAKLQKLWDHIHGQILDGFPVEVLTLKDNKKRTIGAKRNALLQAAQGRYVAFVDDDDWVADEYIRDLLEAATHRPDVIVFPVDCKIPSKTKGELTGVVESSVHFPNEQFKNGGVTRRKPIQIHCWRRELAKTAIFPDTSRGEDFKWAEQLWNQVTKEVRVDNALYLYHRERDFGEAYSA
jgi:glycosyltransferase involved in cell wall biosynthesis